VNLDRCFVSASKPFLGGWSKTITSLAEVSQMIFGVPTAVAICPDGKHVIWGMQRGDVCVANVSKRGFEMPRRLGSLIDYHVGAVVSISFAQGRKGSNSFATSGIDGGIRIWDLDRPEYEQCLWFEYPTMDAGEQIETIALFLSRIEDVFVVACGTRSGMVFFWRLHMGRDCGDGLQISTYCRGFCRSRRAIAYIALDRDSCGTFTALILNQGASHFYRLSPFESQSQRPWVIFGLCGNPPVPVSCIRPVFDAPRKFVVAADMDGRVFVWDWDVPESPWQVPMVLPIRQFQGCKGRVTALEVSQLFVFVGT
jgi:WD40 repeat protein